MGVRKLEEGSNCCGTCSCGDRQDEKEELRDELINEIRTNIIKKMNAMCVDNPDHTRLVLLRYLTEELLKEVK